MYVHKQIVLELRKADNTWSCTKATLANSAQTFLEKNVKYISDNIKCTYKTARYKRKPYREKYLNVAKSVLIISNRENKEHKYIFASKCLRFGTHAIRQPM